jgi:hypothetical protein
VQPSTIHCLIRFATCLGDTRMLAVDMSNFTDPLSPTAIRGLKDAGVGHVIVQAIDPPPA